MLVVGSGLYRLRRVTTVKEMITGGAQERGEARWVALARRARKQAKSSGCDCAFLRACGLPVCVCAWPLAETVSFIRSGATNRDCTT
jgi:hypothetical protein